MSNNFDDHHRWDKACREILWEYITKYGVLPEFLLHPDKNIREVASYYWKELDVHNWAKHYDEEAERILKETGIDPRGGS